jgi:hypothetical protein
VNRSNAAGPIYAMSSSMARAWCSLSQADTAIPIAVTSHPMSTATAPAIDLDDVR